ncbi:ribosome biogenesis GTPase Der [Marinitenerispora sediminis]|uniref:GTPase Der n=1 Tax=Marinitenerispora sediminis TaxID=1931232 RepID=A0A368T855_9ACTN|nr:ribosome biogenesis GTPase Der [Marinitenerispora sediminis]RCV54702.1 ribosome biogenesis GTPase Der [Marinitenerispora sediminis]RCV59453.1 ribosome biogenesis GTPase Der [Marinitenerispora sediminis]RCV60390.1 ribosome biogenesis GTPase Der [Marinitenerispora sediminis]
MSERSDVLNGVTDQGDAIDDAAVKPVVAVVGRPNVGKSSLVNRIIGRREAVVEDVPGVTRDRVAYDATWQGREFTLVDTGGWETSASGLAAMVARQAEYAAQTADVVLFVVDATVGITDADEAVTRVLRATRRPVVLAANKVDGALQDADALELWHLGVGEPYPVSALHGRGSGDLLDAVLEALPEEAPRETLEEEGGPRRIALIGRPNVGKSSLLNRLAGEDRVVVDSVAGTTRDAVDELVELGGRTWKFIDTAGIRRRFRALQGADYYATMRTGAALERAEVAVVLLDVSEPLAEQDIRVVEQVVESGRALVLAFNKWDVLDEERRYYLEKEIDRQLGRVHWAPRVNISARTGRHVEKLVPAIETGLASWDTRISTGRLNSWLKELVAATPPPVRGGKQPKILFGTQADTRPPHFVLFTTGFLEDNYRRFIERRLREDFGFEGSPVKLSMRIREKKGGGKASRGSVRPDWKH